MNPIVERVYEIGIIPVIAFNSVDEAVPLCKALVAGGLPAAEVTFRTACAEDCIKKIHEEVPEMLLGAGTVLTIDQADRAMAAGASFILSALLNMAVKPGNSSIFVGKKEFEIMKKPGRGTHGHIAIKTNNVDRAIYHLGLRGVKFDMDSKVVKNGKTTAIYMADEIAGFAIHLVQK